MACVFKPIKIKHFYNRYLISASGSVYSLTYNRCLRHFIANNRRYITLTKNNIIKIINVDKLVLMSFMPNLKQERLVGFYDMNKNNTKIKNLYWTNISDWFRRCRSGKIKGVYKWKCGRITRWRSMIKINGKLKTFGYFKTKKEALKKSHEEYSKFGYAPW